MIKSLVRKYRKPVLTAVLVVLLLALVVAIAHNLLTNTVLFEDGSVRIAFCLVRSWGCA